MLNVRVVLLPAMLARDDVDARSIVAFDVLRATTTLTAALAGGIPEIVLHPTRDAARAARRADPRPKLLVGEQACLKPDDFDLGNSPAQFTPDHAGKVAHMATTNGTKALLSPAQLGTPKTVLAGALVNRLAVAKALVELNADITLLCAGTEGQPSFEDILGCGAVLESLVNLRILGKVNDAALTAMGTWTWAVAGIVRAKPDEPAYPAGFRLSQGAINLIHAGLAADVAYAARPDIFEFVGQVRGNSISPYSPPIR
jgi:2-phosphosulfolactate phosphatase